MIFGNYFAIMHEAVGKKMPREAEAGGAEIVRIARRKNAQ